MSQIASRGGYGYSSRGGGLDSRRMNSLHGSSGLQNEHGGGRPFGGGNGGPSNSHNRNHDSFDRNPRVVGVPDVSRFTPRGQISDKNPVDVVSSNLSANSAWLEAENEVVASPLSTHAAHTALDSTPMKAAGGVDSGQSANKSLGFLPRAVAMGNNAVPQQQSSNNAVPHQQLVTVVNSVGESIGMIGGEATLPVTPEDKKSISGLFRSQNGSLNVGTEVKLAEGVGFSNFGNAVESSPVCGKPVGGVGSPVCGKPAEGVGFSNFGKAVEGVGSPACGKSVGGVGSPVCGKPMDGAGAFIFGKPVGGVGSPVCGKPVEGAGSSSFGAEPYRKQLASLVPDVDKRNAAVQHPPLNPFVIASSPKTATHLSNGCGKTEGVKVIKGNSAEVNGAARLQEGVGKLLSKEQTEVICSCMDMVSVSFKQMYDALQLFSGAFQQMSVASQRMSTVLQQSAD